MHKLMCVVAVLAVSSAQADTIFVDDDASLGGDGLSWNTAYRFLQDALFDAAGDPTINEIRVAQGTYTPDQDEAVNVIPGDRAATFNLLSGVSMLGGFAGIGAVDPDVRDVVQYTTVLNGDLDGDDGLPGSFLNNAEKSRHVVTGDGTDPSAVLDGFTVTGGNADGPDDPDMIHLARGGGIWNATGSPTVRNCRIEYNAVLIRGGGMYNFTGTSPVVTGCTFRGNITMGSGLGHGGGLRNFECNPIVTDCLFVDNSSGNGGGMDNSGGNAVVTGCVFTGNSSGSGGGMSILFATATVTDCTFSGNTASRGGGMFILSTTATVTNCTFSGNSASIFGGGISNPSSTVTVTNCTFSGNSANLAGGGMHSANSNTTVTNCILWDDSPDEIGPSAASATVTYSDVQLGSLGIGNIDADPLFVGGPSGTWTDPGVFNPAVGVTTFTDTNASFAPDGLVGGFLVPWTEVPIERPIVANTATTISVFTDVAFLGAPGFAYEVNDYRLTAASPCIDAADNIAVPAGITTDLDGNPRFLEIPETPDTGNGTLPIVDMGAYESLGGGCLAVTSQEIVCHADGTTFTVNIEGLNACTGGTTKVTFTASGGAVGEELCFTALVNDGGFCCSTEICVTITDCSPDCDLNGDGVVGILDFLALLDAWGSCSDCGDCAADFDGDCNVGITDFLLLLGNWG